MFKTEICAREGKKSVISGSFEEVLRNIQVECNGAYFQFAMPFYLHTPRMLTKNCVHDSALMNPEPLTPRL